jgi:hypothetical protein
VLSNGGMHQLHEYEEKEKYSVSSFTTKNEKEKLFLYLIDRSFINSTFIFPFFQFDGIRLQFLLKNDFINDLVLFMLEFLCICTAVLVEY